MKPVDATKKCKKTKYLRYRNAELVNLKEKRRINHLKKIKISDLLIFNVVGEISNEEVEDWNFKENVKRNLLQDKINNLSSFFSSISSLPNNSVNAIQSPTRVSRLVFKTKFPTYRSKPIVVLNRNPGTRKAIELIKESISKKICKYRVVEFCVKILDVEIEIARDIVNKISPNYFSASNVKKLKQEKVLADSYAEGIRRYLILNKKKISHKGMAYFSVEELVKILPGLSKTKSCKVSKALHLKIVKEKNHRFLDLYTTTNFPRERVNI